MVKCKLCDEEIKGAALTCSKGTICIKCSTDINLAGMQPVSHHNDILWVLAETFFRRGRGEDTTFEKVWNESESFMKVVKFEEQFKR